MSEDGSYYVSTYAEKRVEAGQGGAYTSSESFESDDDQEDQINQVDQPDEYSEDNSETTKTGEYSDDQVDALADDHVDDQLDNLADDLSDETSDSPEQIFSEDQANTLDDGGIELDELEESEEPELDTMGKVRNIILGNQVRKFEKKFDGMETRFENALIDLREEFLQRYDAFENYTKKEIELLTEKWKVEQEIRLQTVSELAASMSEATQTLEQRIQQIDEQFNDSLRDVARQLLDQSRDLTAEIRRKHEESAKAMRQSTEVLSSTKVERGAMAELFLEMAMRLSDELDSENDSTVDDEFDE